MREMLKPTPIINKNGVLTTVYKKLMAFDVIRKTVMPPPAAPGNNAPRLSDDLEKVIARLCGGTSSTSLRNALSRYSENTLVRLHEFMSAEGSDSHGTARVSIARLAHRGADETVVSDLLNFLPSAPKLYNELISLRYYGEMTHLPVDRIHEDSNIYQRVMALAEMIEPAREALGIRPRDVPVGSPLIGIREPSGECFFIFRDERVIRTILDFPEQKHLIRQTIEDRGTVHYETILDALDVGAALGAGTL